MDFCSIPLHNELFAQLSLKYLGDEWPDEAREGLSDDAMFWMIPSSTKLGDDPGLITALLFPMVEGKCLWGEGCEDTALGGPLLEWFWKPDAASDAFLLNS